MRKGQRSQVVDDWIARIETTIDKVTVETPKHETGLDKFFDETLERDKGRRGRLVEAGGVIPGPMWVMLIVSAACLLSYILLLGTTKERAYVQCIQMGLAMAFIVVSFLLVHFLDHPFNEGTGSIEPSAMRFGLEEMLREGGTSLALPCDASGNAKA